MGEGKGLGGRCLSRGTGAGLGKWRHPDTLKSHEGQKHPGAMLGHFIGTL